MLLRPGDAGGSQRTRPPYLLSRQLLLFAPLHVHQIGVDNALRIASAADLPGVEPQRFVAESLDEAERVRHEQNRFSPALELAEFVQALVGEALIAHGEHLVHEQHVGVDVNGHRKPEAHIHARRVGLHRRVDELLQLGELDDLIEPPGDLALRQAQHDAVDEHVLAA